MEKLTLGSFERQGMWAHLPMVSGLTPDLQSFPRWAFPMAHLENSKYFLVFL